MSEKIFIDFTVFETPTKAHARICGNIEVPAVPIIGEAVRVVDRQGSEIVSLVVRFVSGQGAPKDKVFGLDDVVANSRDEAKLLCNRLEGEAGLEYEPSGS